MSADLLQAVCKKCGGTEFSYEQRGSGSVSFVARADGSFRESTSPHAWENFEYTCDSCGAYFARPELGVIVRANPWAGWRVDPHAPDVGSIAIGEIVVGPDGLRGEVAAIEEGGEAVVLAGWHERFALTEVRRLAPAARRVLVEVA